MFLARMKGFEGNGSKNKEKITQLKGKFPDAAKEVFVVEATEEESELLDENKYTSKPFLNYFGIEKCDKEGATALSKLIVAGTFEASNSDKLTEEQSEFFEVLNKQAGLENESEEILATPRGLDLEATGKLFNEKFHTPGYILKSPASVIANQIFSVLLYKHGFNEVSDDLKGEWIKKVKGYIEKLPVIDKFDDKQNKVNYEKVFSLAQGHAVELHNMLKPTLNLVESMDPGGIDAVIAGVDKIKSEPSHGLTQ